MRHDETNPESPVPALRPRFAELGAGLAAHGRYGEAAEAFDRALCEPGDSPSDSQLNELVALAYEQIGKQADAWRCYLLAVITAPDRALVLAPHVLALTDAVDRNALTTVLTDGRWNGILHNADVGHQARAAIATLLGYLALRSAEHLQAEAMFRRAVALADERADAWSGLGDVLVRTGHPEAALAAYQTARSAAQRAGDEEADYVGALGAVEALLLMGRPAEALDACPMDTQDNPSLTLRAHIAQSRALLATGRANQALQVVREAEALDVGSTDLVLLEALALIALHQNEDAIEVLGQALNRDPTHDQLQFRLIQARMEAQEDVSSIRGWLPEYLRNSAARTALLDDPTWQGRLDDGRACYFRAYLYECVGDVSAALAAIDRALELGLDAELPQPPEAPLRALRAGLLDASGDASAGRQARFEAGRDYYLRGEYATAAELFEQVLEADPAHRPTPWYLADSLTVLASQLSVQEAGTGSEQERLARRADVVWNRALRDGLPGDNEEWAYVVRAAVNSQLRRFTTNSDDLSWSSIAYLECALLRDRLLLKAWLWLARFYRDLDQLGAARRVVERLRSWYPEDLEVLEEAILLFSNSGFYNAALEATAERERVLMTTGVPESGLGRAIRAFCAFGSGRYEQASDLAEQAIAEAGGDMLAWVYEVAARARRMLGDAAGAVERATTLLRRCDPKNLEDRRTIAWALLETGRADEALRLFEDLEQRPTNDPRRFGEMGIGLARLQLGHLEAGERAVAAIINRAPHTQTLVYLDYGLRVVADYTHPRDDVQSAVTRLRDLVERRRDALSPTSDDDDYEGAISRSELERVLRRADEGPAEQASWMRAAARGGLARMAGDRNDWKSAATHYVELAANLRVFPEAALGLRQAAAAAAEQADEALRRGELDTADHYFGEIRAVVTTRPEIEDLHPALLIREELVRILRERSDPAAVTRLLRDVPERLLVETWSRTIPNVVGYWRVDDYLTTAEGMCTSNGSRQSLTAVRDGLRHYLDVYLRTGADEEVNSNLIPVVTPIVLELGEALIPPIATSTHWTSWRLFSDDIPAMRDRVKRQTGVTLTGVRVRESGYGPLSDAYQRFVNPDGAPSPPATAGWWRLFTDDLPAMRDRMKFETRRVRKSGYGAPPDAYRALIHDVPYGTGRSVAGWQFCPDLDAVSAAQHIAAPEPGTGRLGAWVPPEVAHRLQQQQIETWPNEQYVIYDLEAMLRRALDSFLKLDDVVQLVSEWREDAHLSELLDSVIHWDSHRDQCRLGWVVRALAQHNVPLNADSGVVDVIAEQGLADDLWALVSSIRCRLLPRTDLTQSKRVAVPAEFEAAASMREGRWHVPAVLGLDLLSRVRRAVAGLSRAGHPLVLITQRAELRPLLSDLLATEPNDVLVVTPDALSRSGGQRSSAVEPAVQTKP